MKTKSAESSWCWCNDPMRLFEDLLWFVCECVRFLRLSVSPLSHPSGHQWGGTIPPLIISPCPITSWHQQKKGGVWGCGERKAKISFTALGLPLLLPHAGHFDDLELYCETVTTTACSEKTKPPATHLHVSKLSCNLTWQGSLVEKTIQVTWLENLSQYITELYSILTLSCNHSGGGVMTGYWTICEKEKLRQKTKSSEHFIKSTPEWQSSGQGSAGPPATGGSEEKCRQTEQITVWRFDLFSLKKKLFLISIEAFTVRLLSKQTVKC